MNGLLGDYVLNEELAPLLPSCVLSSLSAMVTWISRCDLPAGKGWEHLMPPSGVSLLIGQTNSLSLVRVHVFQEVHPTVYLVGYT